MKKIIKSAIVLMAMSTHGFAMNSGMYAGFGLGVLDYFPSIDVTVTAPFETISTSFDQGKSGFSGEIMLGYSYLFTDSFSLGFQVDGRFANASSRFRVLDTDIFGTDSVVYNSKFKNSGGVNLRPTFWLNESASGFFVLGFRRGNVNINLSSSDLPSQSLSITASNNGLEYGLGTEFCLSEQFSVRFEATQTTYQSKSLVNTNFVNVNLKTKSNQILLGLVWYPNFYLD